MSKTKILFFGDAPWANSGYGKNIRNISLRLKDKYDIGVLCEWGLLGTKINWNGVTVYPLKVPAEGGTFGGAVRETLKTLPYVMKKYKYDTAVLHYDIWSSNDLLMKMLSPWVSYAPVDSDPMSPLFYDCIQTAKEVVTFCDFAHKLLKNTDVPNTCIPHGVDTKVYHPPRDKGECRRKFGIPEDVFVFMICGVNRGPRKGMQEMLEAYGRFLRKHPEAKETTRMYLHTEPTGYDFGYNMINLTNLYDVAANTIFTSPEDYADLSEELMADMFGAGDVFMQCSHSEGFGIPILEAAACGQPCIATDYSSMSELVEGHGIKIRVACKELQARNYNYHAIPYVPDIVKAMEYYYEKQQRAKDEGKKASEWAKGYDWERKIIPLWDAFFQEYEQKYLK